MTTVSFHGNKIKIVDDNGFTNFHSRIDSITTKTNSVLIVTGDKKRYILTPENMTGFSTPAEIETQYLKSTEPILTTYPFELQTARGYVNQSQVKFRSGSNSAVSTTYINLNSGAYTSQKMAAPAILTVTSTELGDDVGSTGVPYVMIEGLDSNFNGITELVELDGINGVATTQQFLRVNDAYCTESQTYKQANLGIIRLHNGTTYVTQINTGEGRANYACYTVPAGKTMYLKNLDIGSDSNKTFDIQMKYVRHYGTTYGCPITFETHTGVVGRLEHGYEYTEKFEEKTDLCFQGKVASGTAEIYAHYSMMLFDN